MVAWFADQALDTLIEHYDYFNITALWFWIIFCP